MFKNIYIFLALLGTVQATSLKQPASPQALSEGFHLDEVKKLEDIKKEVDGLHSLLNKAKACNSNQPQKTPVDFKQKIKEATMMLKAIDKDIRNKKIDLRIIDTKIDEFYQKLDELKCLDLSSSENLPQKSSLRGADVRYSPPIRRRVSDKKGKKEDHISDKKEPVITYQYSDPEEDMASEEDVSRKKTINSSTAAPQTTGSSRKREEALIGG